MPYSAGRMLAPKIAYSARGSAGRIYPSLLRENSISTTRVLVARVNFESRATVRVRVQLLFFSFFLLVLLMSSSCYSLLYNDELVVNGKLKNYFNFQVCNIFHYRSLEPFNRCDSLLLWRF